MRSRLWQQIYAAPGYGLRFFVLLIDGEREAIPRVAVADNSGKTPDKTDDGVLWIDLSRPWLVEDLTFSIPVTREGHGDLWTGESTNALFELLDALRKPEVLGEEALRIKCKVSSRGHMGARAIVKCLALGVNP
jgi:hypothetical protein